MDFVESIKTCLRKYAAFNGRASRPEYWWFALFYFLVSVVAAMFSDVLNALVGVAVLLPSLAVGTRRLHDIGKSGWFQLVWFIPLIGWALMIYWLVQPTGPANEYGTGPELPRNDPLEIPPGL
ncbi:MULTISPECIES: DUF805 domain-containing protein [Ramlibacter]|uniref:DUF805 domain-containing protein n=1 Tax=Ramlibacter pinisoli TaxID=2682844 RepID=A0A6N8IWF7_9BURK|nr:MULTISPECIES: DUF805 domain-containing protein [Ramlibacter]MBA2965362.1 DUF805 domain-containing protein [Ramlibacter sp. CGMCC 1.13660]MVQ30326.1 DUF805 domain-containing protein [Ramlibacter pinisoli]